MHWVFGERFEELLAAWRHHHETRRSRAPYEELVAASRRLDDARDDIYRVRRAIAPTDDERANAALTMVCPMIDAAVSIPWQDVSRADDRLDYRCICGTTGMVDLPSDQASSLSGS